MRLRRRRGERRRVRPAEAGIDGRDGGFPKSQHRRLQPGHSLLCIALDVVGDDPRILFHDAGLTGTLVLRGAYYKAFVRPQPRNLTPSTTVSTNSTDYAIQYGGVDLKPYSATSQDLSLEWYNRPGGLFAVAAYRKVIRNLISPETRLSRLCPADASAFGLWQLTTIGTTCYSNLLVNGQPAIVTATGSFNQPNPITVTGLEVTAQQNFDFLPGLLRNLGGQVNYSYTNISGTNADGTKAVLPGVSKNNVNLTHRLLRESVHRPAGDLHVARRIFPCRRQQLHRREQLRLATRADRFLIVAQVPRTLFRIA